METVLHLHQPAASLPGVAVSGNSVTLADSSFDFERIHSPPDTWNRVWQDSLSDRISHLIQDWVLAGKSASLLSMGVNASTVASYPRNEFLIRAVLSLDSALGEYRDSPSFQLQTAFALIGFSDQRSVNLLTDRMVHGQRLQHGLNESFFEPVDDFSTLISHMKRGFSLPGYAVVIKVELYPARLMTSIDCEMDRNGNVYRGLSTAQPDADGNGLPKCGYFYLFNLGSPHFCTMSTVSSSVPAVNSVASLGESLLELESFLKMENGQTKSEKGLVQFLMEILGRQGKSMLVVDVEMNSSKQASDEIMRGLHLSQTLRAVKTCDAVNRVDDRALILSVMEEKFRHIRKQSALQSEQLMQFAEKLQKHLDIEKQLKVTEHGLKDRIRDLEKDREQIDATVVSHLEEIESLKNRISQDEQIHVTEIKKMEEALSSMQQKLAQVENEKQSISETAHKSITDQSENWKSEKTKMESELKNSNRQLRKSDENRKRLEEEMVSANELIATLESRIKQMEEELALVKDEKNELDEELKSRKKAELAAIKKEANAQKAQRDHVEEKKEVKKNQKPKKKREEVEVEEPMDIASGEDEDDLVPVSRNKPVKSKRATKAKRDIASDEPMDLEVQSIDEEKPIETKKKTQSSRKRQSLEKENEVIPVPAEKPFESSKRVESRKNKSTDKLDEKEKTAALPPPAPVVAKPGIINSHALQMIKANFTMPKLLKKN